MSKDKKEYLINKAQILLMTEATDRQFELWLRDGLGETERQAGLYDARKFYLWYREKIHRPSLGSVQTEDGMKY